MATNTNGPIVKIDLLNDKQQQQHQNEKKEAIEPNKVNERRRANALKNGHQNFIEQISNTGVCNRSTESIGHSKRDIYYFIVFKKYFYRNYGVKTAQSLQSLPSF